MEVLDWSRRVVGDREQLVINVSQKLRSSLISQKLVVESALPKKSSFPKKQTMI
jgi:hypothetical protein